MKREMTSHRIIAASLKLSCLLLMLGLSLPALAQKYPERGMVRKGNRAFGKEKFDRSIDNYREALEAAPENWEATYNLGNALYRTEQYDKAAESLRRAATDSLRTNEERAEAYYNLADVQYKQGKLPEALESLKASLRLNPADEDAKFNYTLIKRQMQQQEQNQDQNQEQNQEQQQQQPEPQNEDQKGDQDEQKQEPEQPQEQPEKPEQAEPQPQEGSLSDQELEQMLDAIQAQEDETQEKLKEKRGVLVRGTKNW